MEVLFFPYTHAMRPIRPEKCVKPSHSAKPPNQLNLHSFFRKESWHFSFIRFVIL